MDPYIGSFAVIVSICVKGYNEIKAESPNAAYQPRQLLKDKDPIHRVEKNAQSICNIAKDSQDEHSDRKTFHGTTHELYVRDKACLCNMYVYTMREIED